MVSNGSINNAMTQCETSNSPISHNHVVIVDTGCANITSVLCALQRLGADVSISADPAAIVAADKVIIPGVGTASQAMANIQAKGLLRTLQSLTQPTLGICLGMQLMTEQSAENRAENCIENCVENSAEAITATAPNQQSTVSAVPCLKLIPGQVLPLQVGNLRLPHMGWNTLQISRPHPILNGIGARDYLYFVHSYAVAPSAQMLASCDYGQQFAAIIGERNFIGMQFHPERSGAVGRRLLANFLNLPAAELWVTPAAVAAERI